MVLFAVAGEMGAGKTLTLTFLTWKNWLLRRRKIFSNYRLYGIPYYYIDTLEKMNYMKDGFFCLPSNESVICEDQVKKISDIKVGDKVFTHKGRFKEVEKLHEREYNGILVNIRTKKFGITTRMTDNHPVYVARPIIKKIKEYHGNTDYSEEEDRQLLKNKIYGNNLTNKLNRTKYSCRNRMMKISEYYNLSFVYKWVKAGDVKYTDLMVIPVNQKVEVPKEKEKDVCIYCKSSDLTGKKRIRCKSCKKSFMPKFLYMRELDYSNPDFLYILGLFLADGNSNVKSGKVRFYVKGEVKKKIEKLLNRTFKLDVKSWYGNRSENDCYCVEINSRKLARYFNQFGKSKNKKLKFDILSLPINLQEHILKGYIDGDGHITGDESFGFTTTSKNIVFLISQILFRSGKIPSIAKYNYGRDIYLGRYGNGHNLIGHFDGSNVLLPISNIDYEVYKGKVHNIDVKEDRSYVLLNGTVHNCADEFWLWCDSRASRSSNNQVVSNILLKSRKRGLTYCFSAQILDTLDKRIRKVCDFSSYPILSPNEDLCKVSIFRTGYPKSANFLRVFYYKTPLVFDMYDTTEEIELPKEDDGQDPQLIFQKDKDSPMEFFDSWEEADKRGEKHWNNISIKKII